MWVVLEPRDKLGIDETHGILHLCGHGAMVAPSAAGMPLVQSDRHAQCMSSAVTLPEQPARHPTGGETSMLLCWVTHEGLHYALWPH